LKIALLILSLTLILLFSIISFAKDTHEFESLSACDTIKELQIFLNRIIIDGNDVTDDEIILRELSIKENSYLNLEDLQNDVQRIYNLGLFTKVDILPVPIGENKINLIIQVEESFYFLPVPIGGFRDNEFKKFWGGINFMWRNFRGRNETIGLNFGLFYEPFINLYYSVPWIGEKEHFFSSLGAGYSVNENQSTVSENGNSNNSGVTFIENYKIKNFKGNLAFGKYITKSFYSYVKFSYNYSNVSEYKEGRTFSEDGIDQYPNLNFVLGYDTRDIVEYTTYGSLYKVIYMKYGFFNNNINFNKFKVDFRKYIPIKITNDYTFTIATRFLNSIAFGGRIPSYLHEFFGYNEIIRGWKTILFEGENQMGIFNEIRIPLLIPGYVKGEDHPFIKNISFLKNFNYKYGIFLTLFFDMGGVWNKNDNFFKTRFRNGFGTGLNFIMPFGFVGRLDLAFRKDDEKFISQLNIALNASF
jgi:outer membrane protein assembly factor BamA